MLFGTAANALGHKHCMGACSVCTDTTRVADTYRYARSVSESAPCLPGTTGRSTLIHHVLYGFRASPTRFYLEVGAS